MKLRFAIFFLLSAFLVGEARSLLSHHKPSLIVRTQRHRSRLKYTKPDRELIAEASKVQNEKNNGIRIFVSPNFSYHAKKQCVSPNDSYFPSVQIYLTDIPSRAPPHAA